MLRTLLERIFNDKRLVRPAEFIIKMLLVYVGWRAFKYVGDTYENFLWGGWQQFKDFLGGVTTTVSANMLLVLGYKLSYVGRVITVDGTSGIYFADLCLGLAPMVIFSGFIFSYGDNTKAKFWFVPLGVAAIFLINALRMVALILIQVHGNNAQFRIAHDYLYVLITYGFIFVMVMWWMNRWADIKN